MNERLIGGSEKPKTPSERAEDILWAGRKLLYDKSDHVRGVEDTDSNTHWLFLVKSTDIYKSNDVLVDDGEALRAAAAMPDAKFQRVTLMRKGTEFAVRVALSPLSAHELNEDTLLEALPTEHEVTLAQSGEGPLLNGLTVDAVLAIDQAIPDVPTTLDKVGAAIYSMQSAPTVKYSN